jgi:uncharacterized repeat protein (TIGR03803 family)
MKKSVFIFFSFILSAIVCSGQGYFWSIGGHVFRTDPEGGNVSVRNKIDTADNSNEFLLASNGKLYATSLVGGAYGNGILIEYDPNTEVLTKKAGFNFIETGSPSSKLLQASNGKIYGIAYGGYYENSLLFEFDIEKNTLANIADFPINSTYTIYGGLTEFNGKLYGTAYSKNNAGTIIEYNIATGELVEKRQFFRSVHGAYPNGKLWLGKNNKLYGFTYEGGANNQGTIFEYNPIDNTLLKKADFVDSQTGAYLSFYNSYSATFSYASLTLAGDGKFYSATEIGGANNAGTIFSFDPATGTIVKEFDFGGNSGIDGGTTLSLGPNGKLYGIGSGGAFSHGLTFEFDPANHTVVKKSDLTKDIRVYRGTDMGGYWYNLVFVASSKTNQLAQTITFENIPQKYFGNPAFELHATSTSGLPVTFSSSDPSIISITNNIATILKSGMVTIYAKQSGNDIFSSEETEQTLEIIKSTPTVTWPTPADIIFGTPLSSDQLNATSSVEGVFTYTPPAGTILNLGNSQNLSLTFTPANTNGYNSVTKQVSINVVKAELDLPEGIVGISGNILFRIDLDGKNMSTLVDFSTKGVSGAVGKVIQSGNGKYYGLTKNGGVNDYGTLFEYDPVSGNFSKIADMNSIGGRFPSGTLIQSSLNGKIYGTCSRGGSDPSAPLLSGHGIIFEYNPATGAVVKVKDFDINISYYTPIYPKGNLIETPTKTLVGIGDNAIYEYDIQEKSMKTLKTFGDDLLQPIDSSKWPHHAIIFVSPGYIFGTYAGLTPSNAAMWAFNYSSPEHVYKGFRFNKSALKGIPNSGGVTELNGKLYGATNSELYEYDLATSTPSKKADFTTATGLNPSSSLTAINGKLYGMAKGGGAYGKGTIFEFDPATGILKKIFDFDGVNGPPNDNSHLFYQPGPKTPAKSPQTITFDPIEQKKYGDAPFPLHATASSGLSVNFSSSNPSVAAISGNVVTVLKAGSAIITASQNGNDTYAAAQVSQSLIVNKITPEVTWNSPSDIVFGTALGSQQLNASSSIAGSFSYSPASGTVLDAGENQTLSVTFTPTDANNYNSATKQVTLNVAKAPQQITFAPITTKTFGEGDFLLNASASSGLAPTFESASDKLSISGNIAGISKAGRATVSASQAGNENYQAATPVSQSFCIRPAKPTISVDNANPANIVLLSSANSGNQWYLNNSAIPNATGQTLTLQSSGSYKVQVSADDCLSEFSEAQTVVVTEVASGSQGISLFPNPAVGNRITVRSESNGAKQVKVMSVTGKEMDFKETSSTEVQFDISSYANGIYIVKVQTENTVSFVRFIKA